MGPLLTPRWRGAGWAALALLPLSGCWPLSFQKPPCVPTHRTEALPTPYDQYFNSLPPCNVAVPAPVSASSSTGLSDSYDGSCLMADDVYSPEAGSACEQVFYAQRSTYAYASLYGYSFTVGVEQSADGPRLRVSDRSTVSATLSAELTYRFAGGLAQLTYTDGVNGRLTYATPPTVTELRNFQNGSRTYAQVWQLTNPLHATRGRPAAVTAYYVARDYGLIRFDLQNGTSWTLAR